MGPRLTLFAVVAALALAGCNNTSSNGDTSDAVKDIQKNMSHEGTPDQQKPPQRLLVHCEERCDEAIPWRTAAGRPLEDVAERLGHELRRRFTAHSKRPQP